MKKQNVRLPGVYELLFGLCQETRVAIGRLGTCSFPGGWYAYIGSGMGGVDSRVRYHLRPHERPHWHIDYLLPHATPVAVIIVYAREPLECALASFLGSRFRVFPRFGSSDCRCPGHLVYSDQLSDIADATLEAFKGFKCNLNVIAI